MADDQSENKSAEGKPTAEFSGQQLSNELVEVKENPEQLDVSTELVETMIAAKLAELGKPEWIEDPKGHKKVIRLEHFLDAARKLSDGSAPGDGATALLQGFIDAANSKGRAEKVFTIAMGAGFYRVRNGGPDEIRTEDTRGLGEVASLFPEIAAKRVDTNNPPSRERTYQLPNDKRATVYDQLHQGMGWVMSVKVASAKR